MSPLVKELESVSRLDVVWDTYLPESLKVSMRQSRGSSGTLRVSPETTLPQNWNVFLRNDANKT